MIRHTLTAEDVLNATFEPTQFREGFDPDEVDIFLGKAVLYMRAGMSLETLVDEAQFTTTRFRDGYDQDEVKDLLARLRSWRPDDGAIGSHRAVTPNFTRPASAAMADEPGDAGSTDQTGAIPATVATSAQASSPSITAEEVDAVRFATQWWRQSYDMGEVDQFLDDVAAALRGDGAVAELADQAQFTLVRFTDGYRCEDVDHFIARLTG